MADDANITRRNIFRGLVPAAVVATLPFQAPDKPRSEDEDSYLILGMYVAMTPAQQADTRWHLRQQGLGDIADALGRIRIV